MLAQMNPPPPHSQHYPSAGDFKPPTASHFHQSQHHSNHHHHHAQFEPQHDDFDDHSAHFEHAQSHHHHGFSSHPHAWSAAGNALSGLGGLPHFGAYDHEPEPEHDDDDDQDHDQDDDHHTHHEELYGHSEDAATPTSMLAPVKRKSSSSHKKEVFMCPEVHCGKTFPRSFALRRHMRIHTGNKPYACDFDGCAQRFNTSGNLSRHKRIHSGERPYPCVFASCGKRFNTSTKLKRHMRIHFPDGQSLFHCVQQACTFACDNYKEYVHHQRQHGNPAYAVPLKGGGAGPQDENVDHSNLLTPTAKGARAKAAAKPKRTPQPRVSKASKAAAEATTAALHGDFLAGLHPPSAGDFDRRGAYANDHSPSTSAASGLSLLMKEAHRESDFDEYDHRRLKSQSHHQYPLDLDRPARLPFPTGAFPSESTGLAAASPMNLNLAATFGSTFTGRSASAAASSSSNATNASSSYYDHAATSAGFAATAAPASSSATSSSFPSYLRDSYAQPLHSQHSSSSYLGFAPLRPEDADDGYDSASSASPHHQVSHHHHHQQQQQHEQHEQPQLSGGADDDDDGKYGSYGNVPHAVGPEFTGEELSAVLELMKDS